MRFFNTAGPVNSEKHYCLPPLSRFNLDEVLRLIGQEKYFVLHAPRQTGKTSCLLALMKHLNEQGEYQALYANVEAGQSAREDVRRGMRAILVEIGERARDSIHDSFPIGRIDEALTHSGEDSALKSVLTEWAAHNSKPIVLMLDEVDALVGDTLISLLRQIRSGYDKRPSQFPQSIILCGVRDVRDYRIHSSREVITGGSAFNIKAKSLRLGDFSHGEMEQLYAQHTAETGQVFEPDAVDLIWSLSRGQPWVVNALAYEACFEMESGRDRSQPISAELVDQAKENLILRRETHLDQLADKLKEDRVRRVIEPLLTGDAEPDELAPDDLAYVRDLGLVRTTGQVCIANDLYKEVIPRELSWNQQVMIPQESAWYIRTDGRLDMPRLLAAFQQFFREHSEHWLQLFEYREAGPQLLLQAFLQRIVNGGGQIYREYGLGRKRTDLLVVWPTSLVATSPPASLIQKGDSRAQELSPTQRIVLELKVIGGGRWKGSVESAIREGLEQTAAYMDRCAALEGHLLIFDRSPEKTWEEKVWRREESGAEPPITVWGL